MGLKSKNAENIASETYIQKNKSKLFRIKSANKWDAEDIDEHENDMKRELVHIMLTNETFKKKHIVSAFYLNYHSQHSEKIQVPSQNMEEFKEEMFELDEIKALEIARGLSTKS